VPVFSENLLRISTHSSQDIIFYAPLLLPAEAALLVLGVALLLWHLRHPTAFLILASGLSVLFVGGTLVAYPNRCATPDQSLDSCLPGLLCRVGCACGRLDKGRSIGVGTPLSLEFLFQSLLCGS